MLQSRVGQDQRHGDVHVPLQALQGGAGTTGIEDIAEIEHTGRKAAIKSYLDALVPWVERGGYIPFCDHRCPPNVKPEDYLYYLDLKEQMFGMG